MCMKQEAAYKVAYISAVDILEMAIERANIIIAVK